MTDQLVVGLGLRDRLTSGLKKSLSGVRRFTSGARRLLGGLGRQLTRLRTAFVGLVPVLTLGGFIAAATQTANLADSVGKLSLRLGLSTELLSEYAFVADRSGVKIEALNVGLQRVIRRLSEFQRTSGGGTAAKGFEILGLTEEALNASGIEELLPKLADGFKRLEGDARGVEAAFSLFDSEGVSFVQFLREGSDGIAKLREEARALGFTLSKETADAAAGFNDSLTNLQATIRGIGQQAFGDIFPDLTAAIQELTQHIRDNREEIVGFVKSFADTTLDLLPKAIQLFKQAANVLATLVEGVTGFFSLGRDAALGFAEEKVEDLEKRVRNLREEVARGPFISKRDGGGFTGPSQEDVERAEEVLAAARRALAKEVKFYSDLEDERIRIAGLAQRARREAAEQRVNNAGLVGVLPGVRGAGLIDPSQLPTPLPRRGRLIGPEAAGPAINFDFNIPDDTEEKLTGIAAGFQDILELRAELDIFRESVVEVADIGVSSLTTAVGELVQGTKSAKEAFRDMVSSILADLARLATRQATTALIGSIVGAFVSPTPTLNTATGGVSALGSSLIQGPRREDGSFKALAGSRGGGGVTLQQTVVFDVRAEDAATFSQKFQAEHARNLEQTTQAVLVRATRDRNFRQALRDA